VSYEHAKATYVTAVDLLQHAIDALEHDPDETRVDKGHPEDAYWTARATLDTVAGMFIAETKRAYKQQ
jgi:hypothetical protein